MIIGHGFDAVDIEALLRLHSDVLSSWEEPFSIAELSEVAALLPKDRVRKLSGKFAAKEAVYKALGGLDSGEVIWREIEILSDVSGKPNVYLSGTCQQTGEDLQVTRWFVSISHTTKFTFASALAIAEI
jgi:holo-[acyl-carrier protein] synthase